jgi:hypothetical protein
MSPEAIHSLIKLFGVEKGIHIINMFTAMDDLELTRQYRQVRPQRSTPSRNLQEIEEAAADKGSPISMGRAPRKATAAIR